MINRYWNKLNEFYGIFAANFFFNSYSGKEKVDIGGLREEVMLFEDDKVMGMTLLNGKIMMNKRLLDEEYSDLRELLIYHERAHRKDGFILNILAGISQNLLHPFGLTLSLAALSGVFLAAYNGLITFQKFSLFWKTLVSAIILAPIISYIAETRAELNALNEMGEKSFLGAYRKSEEEFKDNSGILTRFFTRATHPPAWLTVKINRKFQSS